MLLSLDVHDVLEIISKGAEAEISRGLFLNIAAIHKNRKAKNYRVKGIDDKLRKDRTIQEIRVLQLARNSGLPVPRILDLDKSTWTLTMEELRGEPLKHQIEKVSIPQTFSAIGKTVRDLHALDIIHGDLTTSNMIYTEGTVYLIDFGLGYISTSIEDKAVDLLVLKHILESAHVDIAEAAFKSVLESYKEDYNEANQVVERMEIVENRVRYRSHTMG